MVSILFYGPRWFFGVDSILNGLTLLVALSVWFFSWKVFQITQEKKYQYFSWAFALLSIAFAIRELTDLAIYFRLLEKELISSIIRVFAPGYVAHILFTLIAYAILIGLTFKINDKTLLFLLFFPPLVLLFFSSSYFTTFYLLTACFLTALAKRFLDNYRKNKSTTALLVVGSFTLMALAQIAQLLVIVNHNFYFLAQFSQVASYLVLFGALMVVAIKNKHDQKDKNRHNLRYA